MKKVNWLDHTMNFLSVCLGIAITFAGQGLINRHSERQEVRSSLMLVRNELIDNKSYVEMADTVFTLFSDAARFLIRYEGHYKDAPADSMAMYCNVPLSSYDISHSSEALELLKNSSLFTKIKDLDLSLDIIHTYGIIEDEIKTVRFYHEREAKYLEDALVGKAKEVLSGDGVTAEALWSAITSTNEGRQFLRELYRLQMYHDSSKTKEAIDATISRIDAYVK